ncbi:SRPBCC domain-containing protein [Erysipelothrix anatis]|uniref:SRPBCC domain-containing protein n=1 Tax=Erysipelothrix anatis TaxID=2683713 RepID=UPI00135B859D|nr:SRPBCC domain-containing protein [Erysipelothrix anatis]
MEKISVTTRVNQPIDFVWMVWNDPQHIMKWNRASEDWHTINASNNLIVGGQLLSRMEAKDGSMGFDFGGTYTAIIPLSRIDYVLDDDREVSVSFVENYDSTTITQTFDPEATNPVAFQQAGWQAILDNFATYTENL